MSSKIFAQENGMEFQPPLQHGEVAYLVGRGLLSKECLVEGVEIGDNYLGLVPYKTDTGNPMLDASDLLLPLSGLRGEVVELFPGGPSSSEPAEA